MATSSPDRSSCRTRSALNPKMRPACVVLTKTIAASPFWLIRPVHFTEGIIAYVLILVKTKSVNLVHD